MFLHSPKIVSILINECKAHHQGIVLTGQEIAMGGFNDFINEVGLVEVNSEGNMMSWCNG